MSDNFYALNSKIGVLKKGILKSADYDKILSLTNREDFLNYVRNNPIYKDAISENMERALEHRYTTEFVLKKTEVDIFKKLRHFLYANDKYLADVMLARYQFEDIKIILRSIVEKEKINLEDELLTYGLETFVDYKNLSRCENINQAMDMLRQTQLKRAFANMVDEDVQRLHFHVEMNLDALFFSIARKQYEKLSGESKKILEDYYGSLTDIINIQWILRAKKYYKLSNEEIYSYTLRYGKTVRGDLLKSLVYAERETDVVDILKNTKFANVFVQIESEGITYRNAQNYTYGKQLKQLKSYQNNISTFLKFTIQILIQNENLTRIAEAQKYKLSKEEVMEYLILID